MPKVVDTRQRERAIANSALETLADGGWASFNLRTIGERMGGSMSLVTHYFPNRIALVRGILDIMIEDIREFHETLDEVEDTADARIRHVLVWALPHSEYALMLERARVALTANRDDVAVRPFLDDLEVYMREVFREQLERFVDDEHLDLAVDLARSWTNGVGLSAVEHPDIWTWERQTRALDGFIEGILGQWPKRAPQRDAGK